MSRRLCRDTPEIEAMMDGTMRRAHGRQRGASHEVAEAIALSLKTMELLLASVRGYMQASTAQTLLRMIVEYCAGLV